MKKIIPFLLSLIISGLSVKGQSCTPQGNQTSYGTNNVWIGYVYDNLDLTSYKGYVNEGTASSPNFDEQFGGSNVYYATNGCSVQTETFSVRYKLTKNFTSGSYTFTVGADDGYRLSLDGGSTWVINNWALHSYTSSTYTVTLSGNYNMVLEYYENGGDNRVTFSVSLVPACGTENTNLYGTNNSWNGYLYDGVNFNTYAGMVHEGSASDPSFTENFGGSDVQYATSGCNVETETFSARYRLSKTFAAGIYTFTVGGDDGYRFSTDGGATWLINNWTYHSYTTSTATVTLNGTYQLVLEFFEGGGDNYLSFMVQTNSTLPIKLINFSGKEENGKARLDWEVTGDSNPDQFEIEKSTDGIGFIKAGSVNGKEGSHTMAGMAYTFTDTYSAPGRVQYRLKMTDLDGKITYSKAIVITIDNNGRNGIKIYPTVVTNNRVSINSNEKLSQAEVMLIDFSGKIIRKTNYNSIQSGETVQFDLGSAKMAAGIYVIKMVENGQLISTQKIIVQ